MAQTKLQKRLKALQYWLDRFESIYIRKHHPKDLLYIHNQITCLTEKLKGQQGVYTTTCPLCRAAFIQLNLTQLICPFCLHTFDGVTMQVSQISEAFVGINHAVSNAASSILRFQEVFSRNSTYGVK